MNLQIDPSLSTGRHTLVRRRILLEIFIGLLMYAMPTLAFANPSFEAETKVIAAARADGTLIGFAVTCNVLKSDVSSLATKLEAASLELAESNSVTINLAEYREFVAEGIDSTRLFASQVAPGSEAFERNCWEIREKVRGIVGK
jgi:hypothetical protein